MVCHACQRDAAGVVARLIENGVRPGEPGHDIVYSQTVVLSCSECGASEIEVYDHDCFDHDDVFDRHQWYLLDRNATKQLRVLLEGCPAPLSADCLCAVHDALRTSCGSLPSSGNFGVRQARLDVIEGLPRIRA